MAKNGIGILDVYREEVERQADILKMMPAGDERAARTNIIVEIRGLLAAADHAINGGRRADMVLDDIERLLSKI